MPPPDCTAPRKGWVVEKDDDGMKLPPSTACAGCGAVVVVSQIIPGNKAGKIDCWCFAIVFLRMARCCKFVGEGEKKGKDCVSACALVVSGDACGGASGSVCLADGWNVLQNAPDGPDGYRQS